MTLTEFVVFCKIIHVKLENQNQKKSQYDMMQSFEAALKKHTAHLRLIIQYKKLVYHNIAERTYKKMTKHVLDCVRDGVATNAGTTAGKMYHDDDEAFHAVHLRPTSNGDRKPPAFINTANPAITDPVISMLTANMQSMNKAIQTMARYQPLATAGHSDPDDSDDDRQYFFAHGYDKGHDGSICAWMKKNTSKKYTDAMRSAKAPCLIDGIHGSTKNL